MTYRVNFQNKYSKFVFPETIRNMKLKLSILAYDKYPLQKVCILFSVSNCFRCYGNLNIPIMGNANIGDFCCLIGGNLNFILTELLIE